MSIFEDIDETVHDKFVTLEMIFALSPSLDDENPITFEIYLAENDKYLTEYEKTQIKKFIERLRKKINHRNKQMIEYMERDKLPAVDALEVYKTLTTEECDEIAV